MSDVGSVASAHIVGNTVGVSERARQRSAEIAQKFPDYSPKTRNFSNILRNAQLSTEPFPIPTTYNGNGKHPEGKYQA